MKRIGLKLEDSEIAWKYQNNTVIISYDKPEKIIELDKKKLSEIANMGDSGTIGSAPKSSSGSVRSLLGGP